jgi:hypothetical protein|tara:strand:- start:23 stop:481 length:459 start_codon:yes stop_codon:yes gene_type:complete
VLAHVRNGELIRTFQGNIGRVECENGDVVTPPVVGYVNGSDLIVPYVTVTVDNSTTNYTDQTRTVLFDGNKVVKTITISDTNLAEVEASVRATRNDKLAVTDWVTSKAVEQDAQDGLGVKIPLAWLNYRQALRDITKQEGFPYSVTWPTEPS